MKFIAVIAACVLALAPCAASAQTAAVPSAASRALTACVLQAATHDDDIILMRWIFFAMARHPSVSQYASITDAQRVDANRQMGAFVNRVVLDSCSNETRAAFAADGAQALGDPFHALGERAMEDIMGNPDVNAAIIEMTAYIDQARLRALVSAAPATAPH